MYQKLARVISALTILSLVMVGCSSDDGTPAGPTPTGLQVSAASSTPAIDGAIDAVWSEAAAYNVIAGSSTTNANSFGSIPVTLKAMTSNNRLYLLAQWDDPSTTESISKKQWSYSAGSWVKSTEDEDRFFVMFDAGNNGAEGADCATMCHQPSAGLMATTGGGNVDVWHWKAARTNPASVADDKWWSGTGRGSDAKVGSAYTDNVQLVGIVEYPAMMHSSLTTAFNGKFLLTSDATAFDSTLDWTGATIPYYTIDPTASGSRWEVSAKAVYAAGVWTLEMSRALNTGNADDVVLGTGSVSMTIAVTDNSGGNHSGAAPFNLVF